MSKKPRRSCYHIRTMSIDSIYCRTYRLTRSSMHYLPHYISTMHHLGMQCGQCQRTVSIRAIEIQPNDTHRLKDTDTHQFLGFGDIGTMIHVDNLTKGVGLQM